MRFHRSLKYYFLRFIRLKGKPEQLALGMALGIFSGMLPIIPFHMALAVALALFFKGSKITALIGSWISNPLTWYILYNYNYRIGSSILGLPKNSKMFSSLMQTVEHGDGFLAMLLKITGAGSKLIGIFTLGGLTMGIVAAVPAYFIFLKLFQFIHNWRQKNKEQNRFQKEDK